MLHRRQFLTSFALLCPTTRGWANGLLPIPQLTKGRARTHGMTVSALELGKSKLVSVSTFNLPCLLTHFFWTQPPLGSVQLVFNRKATNGM